ncbi:MAG: indolepyruvate oxidoreductase subunit beta [Desulfomonile tiedjei]|uniref:Indolepyruvate oxidoreductase subunit beta n=1 Tax=Desulfomonile tiedjei TaxID=2358 RepID=A0A9D6V064_9BACT|nr:indolepyruvate oxidoreductase subunit beta [Desulfomonile tiedjei]
MNKDPYNLVVAGVGGQGNVLGSQLIGTVLVNQGYKVTIGETYGASQRGGSVMSHVRISAKRQYGPLIPPRFADLVIALEPSEAARVLARYGNRNTVAIVNTRPVYSIDVTGGAVHYPETNGLMEKIRSLTSKAYFLDATDRALQMGNPILANIIMIGAVSAAGILPITESNLEKAISEVLSSEKVSVNLKAFAVGKELIASQISRDC